MMRILSLGAGVQSSTLALMMAANEIESVDCAIFADTQNKPAAVMQWLSYLETLLPFPVHRVTRGNLAESEVKPRGPSKKTGKRYLKNSIPAFVKQLDGSVGMFGRRCTGDFKIEPVIRKLRQLMGVRSVRKSSGILVRQAIGISLDEYHRMKPSQKPWIQSHWPLVEAKMTRRDCLQWMESRGFPRPPRSACVFCPYHSDEEWLRLKKEEPKEFDFAVAFEKRLNSAVKNDQDLITGEVFLHRSLVPLDEVKFSRSAPSPRSIQLGLFGNECEGLCGV
jgi:hypothetical protein